MDRIFYTGKATKEEVIQELHELLSRFLEEIYYKKQTRVDE